MDVSGLWLWLACTTAGVALYLLLGSEGAARKWLTPSASTVLAIASVAIALEVVRPLDSGFQTILWVTTAAAAIGGLVLLLVAQPPALQLLGAGVALAGAVGLIAFTGEISLSFLLLCGGAAVAIYRHRGRRTEIDATEPPDSAHDEAPREPLLSVLMWVLLTAGLLSLLQGPVGSAEQSDGHLPGNQLACGSVVFVTGLLILVVAPDVARRTSGLVAAHLGGLVMLLAWGRQVGDGEAAGFALLVLLLLAWQLGVRLQLQSGTGNPATDPVTERGSRAS
ncbi:MAG: hypothetical protein DWQ29_06790 [Planctomycetota bacterium]|nr:MAG: hypothetical protein DWQ29_06790 [Planctomycetota bacterium]